MAESLLEQNYRELQIIHKELERELVEFVFKITKILKETVGNKEQWELIKIKLQELGNITNVERADAIVEEIISITNEKLIHRKEEINQWKVKFTSIKNRYEESLKNIKYQEKLLKEAEEENEKLRQLLKEEGLTDETLNKTLHQYEQTKIEDRATLESTKKAIQ